MSHKARQDGGFRRLQRTGRPVRDSAPHRGVRDSQTRLFHLALTPPESQLRCKDPHCMMSVNLDMVWNVWKRTMSLPSIQLRMALGDPLFGLMVKAGENDMGHFDIHKNLHNQLKTAGGPVGKARIARVWGRGTKQVAERVVPGTTVDEPVGVVQDRAGPRYQGFTGETKGCLPLRKERYDHRTVTRSASEYQRSQDYANMVESFWATRKCDDDGVYCEQGAPTPLRVGVPVHAQPALGRRHRPETGQVSHMTCHMPRCWSSIADGPGASRDKVAT